MRERIKELRTERVKLVHDARSVLKKADDEKRDLSSEEKAQWDEMMKKVDALAAKVAEMERTEDAVDDTADDADTDDRDDEEYDDEDRDDEDDEEDDKERAKKLFGKKHAEKRTSGKRTAPNGKPGDVKLERREGESNQQFRDRERRSTPEYRAAWNAWLVRGDQALRGRHARAISADSDIVGGYLIAPQEFTSQLIKFVDNLVYIRQKATKYTVNAAQSLGAPSLDADPADSDWTSELATGNEDTSFAFGKRELTPHPLAKRLKVSKKLMRLASISGTFSAFDSASVGTGPESLVRSRLGYKFGVTEEKAFYTGNGAQQPLGLFTASTRGISTGRDVQTGSTTTFTADAFFTAKWTLKSQYLTRSEWYFNRTAMPKIQTLKDGFGQYIWQPGLQMGEPDKLLGLRVNVSEYVPNTFTTGLYVGLLGDMSFYWIADSEQMEIQRLEELYAEANQLGFIARRELDAMPVLEEAFVRLILN
jgi:HK97 family phage major capsid protein